MTTCEIKSNLKYYDYVNMQPLDIGMSSLLKWHTPDFDLVLPWTDRSIYQLFTYSVGTGCTRVSVHPSGVFGEAFNFNGTLNANMKFPSISLPGEFTVCFWIKKSLDISHGITGNSIETALTGSKIALSSGGPVSVRIIQGQPKVDILLGIGNTINVWEFITVTRDINNIISASRNAGTPVNGTTALPGIYVTDIFGKNSDGQYLNGILGEIMIYNRFLSQTETITNYVNSPFYRIKLGI